ncbi:HupE/UreJ family protein [Archangium sp.]|uniref:HupE/UreJ family protein n=1 Tax=Archangium sp. TaxID=1872627 RepID=UPI00286A806C|nr:HupE/UreJ family protein [Archangium sp.]
MKRLFGMVVLLASLPVYAHGISEADKQAMLGGGLLRYVGLGASHMLSGYDHLLFLFGVIFFLTSARDIVKFISVFTLGHSLTLIFATFAGVTKNYYLVDAVIALSVCYKGFDNNGRFESYLGVKAPNLLVMVFGFGLIHGFGLSTRLQQLPLGEKGLGMLGRIIAFNVGVELGQIVALLGMLFLLSAWRKRPGFQRFSLVANEALVLCGLLLFLMQMHGYLHTRHPGDFGFNTEAHSHAHEHTEVPAPVQHDNL